MHRRRRQQHLKCICHATTRRVINSSRAQNARRASRRQLLISQASSGTRMRDERNTDEAARMIIQRQKRRLPMPARMLIRAAPINMKNRNCFSWKRYHFIPSSGSSMTQHTKIIITYKNLSQDVCFSSAWNEGKQIPNWRTSLRLSLSAFAFIFVSSFSYGRCRPSHNHNTKYIAHCGKDSTEQRRRKKNQSARHLNRPRRVDVARPVPRMHTWKSVLSTAINRGIDRRCCFCWTWIPSFPHSGLFHIVKIRMREPLKIDYLRIRRFVSSFFSSLLSTLKH